jgi:PhzF family phenazine biosynthesis protein
MKVEVNKINAFSINNTGGNPAGVVLNADGLTTADKQLIAAKMGIPETAFVSNSTIADVKLDFFTPVKQIAHCGHATIATFCYLKQTGRIRTDRSSKETIDGIRAIYFEGDEAYMEQRQPAYFTPSDDMGAILNSLNITQADIAAELTPCIVNTGNSFLVIPVKDEVVLKNIQPVFDEVEGLSQKYNLIGYYAYTTNQADSSIDAAARMFAPLYGINEEAATGMAAGPLACFLYKNGINKTVIKIQQGKYMQPPSASLIKVNLNMEEGKIVNLFAGGSAFVAGKETVEI